jgi:2-(3-amino-3-carboxypropyl)histidine synthase
MKILYVPCHSNRDPIPALRDNAGILSGMKTIGVAGTSQHLNALQEICEFLERKGHETLNLGQVLGCNQGQLNRFEGDCILYVGSGSFHPTGMAYASDKPIYLLNPLSGTLKAQDESLRVEWEKKKKGRLMKALAASTYAILVSTKTGQHNLQGALDLREKLKSKGKKAYIIAAAELTPDNILPFPADCLINTACPRMAGDHYHIPIVNHDELIPHL